MFYDVSPHYAIKVHVEGIKGTKNAMENIMANP